MEKSGPLRPMGAELHGRRAVFIDRDGTLVREKRYLADPERVDLVPGAAEALERLRGGELALVVVTNQSGIARGLYTEAQYHAVARRLDELLEERGVPVDGTYYCPHHPEYTGPCPCRKPGTGMFRLAAQELGLALEGSYFVGDRSKDVLPALALRGTGILVRTGFGRESEAGLHSGIAVEDDLLGAAHLILGLEAGVRRGA